MCVYGKRRRRFSLKLWYSWPIPLHRRGRRQINEPMNSLPHIHFNINPLRLYEALFAKDKKQYLRSLEQIMSLLQRKRNQLIFMKCYAKRRWFWKENNTQLCAFSNGCFSNWFPKKQDRRPRVNPRILQFPQAPVQGDQRTIKSTTRECSNLEQPVWFFRVGFEEVAKKSPTANAVFNQRWDFTSNSRTKNNHKFARKKIRITVKGRCWLMRHELTCTISWYNVL